MRFLVPALGLVLLSSSCTLNTDYFSEYRGVNLLGNYDFNALQTDGVTPKWSLATSTDFMTWERIGDPTDPNGNLTRDVAAATPVVGANGTSPVYRLEVKNLIPNGDFDNAAITPDLKLTPPPFWSVMDTTVTTPSTVNFGTLPSPTNNNTTGITNRVMAWVGGATGDELRFDVDSAVKSVSPSAWSPQSYLIRFDFINIVDGSSRLGILFKDTGTMARPGNSLLTYLDGVWDTSTLVNSVSDHKAVFAISNWFKIESASDRRTLVFGSEGQPFVYGALLDNVRLLPAGQQLQAQATFPSLSSGTKVLLPGSRKGMYRFTVDVHDDPTAGFLNRFQPRSFTILLKARTKSGIQEEPLTIDRPLAGWTTWTTLVADVGFDFVNKDSELGVDSNGNPIPALVIALRPTVSNQGDSDVGSILVSNLTLSFNP